MNKFTQYQLNRLKFKLIQNYRKWHIFIIDLYLARYYIWGGCRWQAIPGSFSMRFFSNLNIWKRAYFPVAVVYHTPLLNHRKIPHCSMLIYSAHLFCVEIGAGSDKWVFSNRHDFFIYRSIYFILPDHTH